MDGFLQEVKDAGDINGIWKIVTIDTSTSTTQPTPPNEVDFWTLNLSTGLQPDLDVVVPAAVSGTGLVAEVLAGSVTNIYPTTSVASPTGIGPGLVVAADNTLGSFSSYEGRIYAAFVGYYNIKVDGIQNPTDDTDIFLTYSDNGGRTWSTPEQVDDDSSDTTGNAASNDTLPDVITGRVKFQPQLAVDPVTGTVVLSWRDGSDNAARSMVATYIVTSINGGRTFSAQVYANPSQTAINAITGATEDLGPKMDNESGGNSNRDPVYGFGTQMGLAVYDGQLYPVFAGDFNQSTIVNGAAVGVPLSIQYVPMAIAAGPRILSSTMGPVTTTVNGVTYDYYDNPQSPPGSPISFNVTFDRPINPPSLNGYTTSPSFTAADVQVYYHDTTNGDPSIPLLVTGVTPVLSSGVGPEGKFGYTEFTVTFDPTTLPDGSPSGITNYTGTYSYMILPDDGGGTAITSPIRAYVNSPVAQPVKTGVSKDVPLPIPTAGTGGSGTADDITTSTITLSGASYTNATITGITVNLSLDDVRDGSLTITLTAPNGVSTLLYENPGDNGADFTNTTFSDLATESILAGTAPYLNGTYQPFNPLSALNGSQVNGTYTLTIDDFQKYNSGELLNWSITVNSAVATLGLETGAPMDQNADGLADENPLTTPYTGLAPGDVYAVPTPQPIAPATFSAAAYTGGTNTGGYILNAPFNQNTLPLIVSGPQVETTSVPDGGSDSLVVDGTASTIDVTFDRPMLVSTFTPSQVLDMMGPAGAISGPFTVTPVNEDIAAGTATEFQIGFPLQDLSGTYTFQLSPTIEDAFGDQLDTTQTAGLDVLRDTGQNNPTQAVSYTATGLPETIPAPTPAGDGVVTSNIVVPDSFIIQGDTTTAGVSGLRVQLSITYPYDPDLTATLYYNMGKADQVAVTLFSGVGTGINTANFSNTVFDDNAATPIQDGSAPFFATFNPQIPLSDFAGLDAQGTWTLEIQNASTATSGNTGTLTSWSLSFREPVPTSGLGQLGSDDVSGSFRIFNLGQADSLSSEQWTSVGPAAVTGSSSGQVSAIAVDPSDPSGNTVYVAGASGGIWKTTDFLTTSPSGPTYVPLTNFGPNAGINVSSIAIFPRNGDPNQSIIIAGTGSTTGGEGNSAVPGVGFLISLNGGATWNLYDSSVNVVSPSDSLPIDSQPASLLAINSPSRNRTFVGDTINQIAIDPQLTTNGQMIIYAAVSGPTGGIWRSEDSGQEWFLMLAGNATAVVLDPNSGTTVDPNTNTEVNGNLQIVYAGFENSSVSGRCSGWGLHEPQPGWQVEHHEWNVRQWAHCQHIQRQERGPVDDPIPEWRWRSDRPGRAYPD